MIYADYNATGPMLPEVFQAMSPFLQEEFGNPSAGSSALGKRAKDAIEHARLQVAQLVGADSSEIVFTSGATESCFLAILGAYLANGSTGSLSCSAVEHPAVLEPLSLLALPPFCARMNRIALDPNGLISESSLPDDGILTSIMLANNETGILFPVREIAKAVRQKGELMHSDVTQAVGRIDVNFCELGLDLMSFSAHKIGGPKGIGALVVRRGTKWLSPLRGGGQEGGQRGGTESVAGIVGFGRAAELARERLSNYAAVRIEKIRDTFEELLQGELVDLVVHGESVPRLPNTSSIQIDGILGSSLVEKLAGKKILISAGSACHTGKLEPSHVLLAMGLSTNSALSTVRISFGTLSKEEDAKGLSEAIVSEVRELRKRAIGELRTLLR